MKPGMSLGKIQEMLRKEGKINTKTGNPPTIVAIQKSAYSYVVRGSPEVVEKARREFAHLKATEEAVIVDDKYWAEWMLHMIRIYYHDFPHQQQKWIARHGLQIHAS